jgi:NAD(P)-dependent dehydrogenase (short-subunit alcohol dehydrogenase family)
VSLKGRCALVTGAGRGIGFVTARFLREQGMAVAVNDIDPALARSAADEIGAFACPGDVSSSAEVARMFELVEAELGPLWLLVNNAGTFHSAPAEEFPEEHWDREFAIDVKAAFLCSQAAIRRMMPRRGGRIIVVSSIAGTIVRTRQIAYCAAKAAAIHFSRCLAVEMAPHGITVNCVCPGMTDSQMLRQTAASRGVAIEDYLEMIPAGTLARPEDHASLIAWLASEEAGHLTGQVISVDGAQSLYHPVTRQG